MPRTIKVEHIADYWRVMVDGKTVLSYSTKSKALLAARQLQAEEKENAQT